MLLERKKKKKQTYTYGNVRYHIISIVTNIIAFQK